MENCDHFACLLGALVFILGYFTAHYKSSYYYYYYYYYYSDHRPAAKQTQVGKVWNEMDAVTGLDDVVPPLGLADDVDELVLGNSGLQDGASTSGGMIQSGGMIEP